MNDTAARVHHRHQSQIGWAMRCLRDENARYRIRLIGVACALVLLTACGGERTAASPVMPTAAVPPTRPASPLPNAFQISFSADPACTMLPPVARTRSYSASVGENGIDLGNATFGGGGSYFWHTIYTRFVEDVAHLYFQDPPVWERLTADQYVVIYGIEAVGTVRDLPATLSFRGSFTFCAEAEPDRYPECVVPEIVCKSTDHKLTIIVNSRR
jgi:hypothetical protein